MTNTVQTRLKSLGEVEQIVMDYLWTHGPSSAEACREALASSRPMKDSTIRTVLRRLEEKGYLMRIWDYKQREWCRVSIGTLDEMKGFVKAFDEVMA